MGAIPQIFNSKSDRTRRRKGMRQAAPTFPEGPITGDLFFETDANQLWVWNGVAWQDITGGGGGVTDHGALTGLADDDHAQYQKESEKGSANGYASLDGSGFVPDAQIPSGIARDSEITSAISTHSAAGDPHSVYATDADLVAHAATSHGGAHPDLAAHDTLGLATQAELDSHAGAADPHTGYQKESEKGSASGYASLDANTRVPQAQIASGTASSGFAPISDGSGGTAWTNIATEAELTSHTGAADPHTGYVLESLLDAKGDIYVATADNTVAKKTVGSNGTFLKADSTQGDGLIWSALADADIPAAIARDTEVTSAISTHEGLSDPHTGYQKESEKGAASGYASLDAGTKVPTAQLGSGTANSSSYLRGDQTWAAVAGGHSHDGAGTNSTAVGDSITASADQSVAIGDFSVANADGAIVIGAGTNATSAPEASAQGAIAIGPSNASGQAGARAGGANSIAIGSGTASAVGANAGSASAIAIGPAANASNTGAIGIGQSANATGLPSVALGYAAQATAADTVAIGEATTASATESTAIGSYSRATTGTQAIAIGAGQNTTAAPFANAQGAIAIGGANASGVNGARASGVSSIAIGSGDAAATGAIGSGADSIALGRAATGSAADGIAIGRGALASITQGVALGRFAQATTGAEAIAIGGGVNTTAAPNATAQGTIAIGASNGAAIAGARASATLAIAIGGGDASNAGANASSIGSIAIGYLAAASGSNESIAIGSGTTASGGQSVAMGKGSTASSSYAMAVGHNVVASTGVQAMAIGSGPDATAAASATGSNAIAIGNAPNPRTGARATATSSIAIGAGDTNNGGATASGGYSIAIGHRANAAHSNSVALGVASATTANNQIMLGTSGETVRVPGFANLSNYADMAEVASPATPASGFVRLYAKADGLLYSKDDAGVETVVTGAADFEPVFWMGGI